MILTRLFLAALLTWSAVSCSFHRADIYYPTVAEADAADVNWGMTQRKPRGGPKQMFPQSRSSDTGGMAAAPAMMAPAQPAAVATPSPVSVPTAPAPVAVPPPGTVNSLR
jgi:hypothetical protein